MGGDRWDEWMVFDTLHAWWSEGLRFVPFLICLSFWIQTYPDIPPAPQSHVKTTNLKPEKRLLNPSLISHLSYKHHTAEKAVVGALTERALARKKTPFSNTFPVGKMPTGWRTVSSSRTCGVVREESYKAIATALSSHLRY